MDVLPDKFKKVLLGFDTSKPNKLWLAISWQQKYYLEWKWVEEPIFSRLAFKFAPEDDFKIAKSFEEDVHSKMKFLKPPKEIKE
jgi:hypothetical protein